MNDTFPRMFGRSIDKPLPGSPNVHGPGQTHRRDLLWPFLALLAAWVAAILVINPLGEFTINDDWGYVFSLESLMKEGRYIATGWGHGGPALLVHILWAMLIVTIFGFSLTTLRLGVLTLGIVGSLVLLRLMRSFGLSRRLSLFVALLLAFNPLYLSQSFTFMTDITFASIVAMALLAVYSGLDRGRTVWLYTGFILFTLAILTRQIGIVLPAGFVVACLFYPQEIKSGRVRVIVSCLVLTIGPWLAYEFFLSAVGSTPVTEHDVFRNILGKMAEKGWPGYLVFIWVRLVHVGLGYTAFFLSPLIVLRAWPCLRRYWIRITLGVYAVVFLIFETMLFAGWIDPPVVLHYNVLTDFGIGPLLFKDTYLLGISRYPAIPTPLFYLFVFWTIPPAVWLTVAVAASLRRIVLRKGIPFIGSFSLLSGLAYLAIITVTGFHDRYLIPVFLLMMVWLMADRPEPESGRPHPWAVALACVFLSGLTVFSIIGTHDFMATKRAALKAHVFLLDDLGVQPCHVDGGFEFNGYYCYRPDFQARPELSWWWVEREDYLVTLGPLPGYQMVRTFPVGRYLGPSGAVYVLQPL